MSAHVGATPRPEVAAYTVEQQLLDDTAELVALPSVSAHESDVADLVEARLAAHPHLEVLRFGNSVIARTREPAPGDLLLCGHLDTVPPSEPPQSACRLADRVTGRGAVDMKGGISVMLRLAERSAAEAGVGCTFVFYDREELGSHRSGMRTLVDTQPELLRADAAVVLEPTDGWVEAGCQGSLRIRAVFSGVAAHTARPWRGQNAIARAMPVVERCVRFTPEHVVVQGLDYRQVLEVVGVRGGGDSNVVPDRCEVVVNGRYAPNRSRADALAEMVELLDGADDYEITLDSPAAMPALDQPALQPIVRHPDTAVRPKLGWTDVGRLAELGIPGINFGPGDPELAHGPAEEVTGASLRFTFQRLDSVIREGAGDIEDS